MINIIDVIIAPFSTNCDQPCYSVIVDRMPVFLYETADDVHFYANDDGFYANYHKKHDRHADAFAGREFKIPMKDGTFLEAKGQYWAGGNGYTEPVREVGINTIDGLHKSHIYYSGCVSEKKLNDWLANNKHSVCRNKYEKGDYLRKCTSCWDNGSCAELSKVKKRMMKRKYPDQFPKTKKGKS